MVLSDEGLAKAGPEVIQRVVDDLGPDRVYVGMALRPLSRVMPSTWQQRVQAGLQTPFEEWLEQTLEEDEDDPASVMYWNRHDHLIARWARVVGPERIRVIVLNASDQTHVLRAFEALVGLRTGTLQAHRDMANRSLTWPEAEAVRSLNLAVRQHGVDPWLWRRVRRTMVTMLKREDPLGTWPSVAVPEAALERVWDLQVEIVNGIMAAGVPVTGRLDDLRQPLAARPVSQADGDAVPAELVSRLGTALLISATKSTPKHHKGKGSAGSGARRTVRIRTGRRISRFLARIR